MNALMPILRRNNFLSRRRDSESDLFDRFFNGFGMPTLFDEDDTWMLAMDVSETETDYLVKAELPGIKKDDIDISMTDGMLTIKGEKRKELKEEKEDYHFVETSYGSFSRSFHFPATVSLDEIDAKYTDGVLTITVPKTEAAKPKKVEVH